MSDRTSPAPIVTMEHANRRFVLHLRRNGALALLLIAASLLGGMAGYHWLAGFAWIDAFVNASMLLGGMGPVDPLPNDRAKLFAGAYAMYCGLLFIAVTGLLITPVANHVLHRFHMERKS